MQLDDRVMVYRGADQADMSVINPEANAWQYIKVNFVHPQAHGQVPELYLATNWPLRYASISSDGKLIAVAGRRGLTHYSNISGRWKLFEDERQEREFVVRGGLLWFGHVLIAAVDVDKTHQVSDLCSIRSTLMVDQAVVSRNGSRKCPHTPFSISSGSYTCHVFT